MRLGELVEGLGMRVRGAAGSGAHLPGDVALTRICDITEDSRTVVPGSLFVARGGIKQDGKRYIADALRAGAVAVVTDDASSELPPQAEHVPVLVATDVARSIAQLAERFYGQPGTKLDLFGVTGTNGKTTVSALVWQLLNAAQRRCGLIGTVMIDDGTEVAPAAMTTPPAMEVSRSLARMHEAGCVACAMEVSSHALDQKRAEALRFRAAGFTNLTGDHLDYHGTMENYAAAKARLFTLLAPGGVACINAQDPWAERMVRDCTQRVVRLGVLSEGAGGGDVDASARVLRQGMDGMLLRLRGGFGEIEALAPLVGTYNAFNVLLAACVAHELGVGPEALARSLPHLQAPPGRLERVSAPNAPIHVFVDYAHTDDALVNVLRAVGTVMPERGHAGARLGAAAGSDHRAAHAGRLWVVFGCGGDRDRTKRPRMGKAAVEHADCVVVTSDNPRTERPGDIIDEILRGMPVSVRQGAQGGGGGGDDRFAVQVDRARAIEHAIARAREGDVVVIAGKGHETEQILPDGQGGTVRTHFDDREVARSALRARGIETFAPQPGPGERRSSERRRP